MFPINSSINPSTLFNFSHYGNTVFFNVFNAYIISLTFSYGNANTCCEINKLQYGARA